MEELRKGRLVLLQVDYPLRGLIAFSRVDGFGKIIEDENLSDTLWVYCLPVIVDDNSAETENYLDNALVTHEFMSRSFKMVICTRGINDNDLVSVKLRNGKVKLKAEDNSAIITKYEPSKFYSEEDVLHILAMLTHHVRRGRLTYKEAKEWWNLNKNSKSLWNREKDAVLE